MSPGWEAGLGVGLGACHQPAQRHLSLGAVAGGLQEKRRKDGLLWLEGLARHAEMGAGGGVVHRWERWGPLEGKIHGATAGLWLSLVRGSTPSGHQPKSSWRRKQLPTGPESNVNASNTNVREGISLFPSGFLVWGF